MFGPLDPEPEVASVCFCPNFLFPWKEAKVLVLPDLLLLLSRGSMAHPESQALRIFIVSDMQSFFPDVDYGSARIQLSSNSVQS